MIFIDLFYTIQVSKDFNGFVKTNAMIFPVVDGLFVIPFELPFHRSEYIPSISSSIAEPNRPEQDGSFATGEARIVAWTWSPVWTQLGESWRLEFAAKCRGGSLTGAPG